LCSPASSNSNQKDGTQLIEEYGRLGLKLVTADHAVEAGIQAVSQRLSSDSSRSSGAEPSIEGAEFTAAVRSIEEVSFVAGYITGRLADMGSPAATNATRTNPKTMSNRPIGNGAGGSHNRLVAGCVVLGPPTSPRAEMRYVVLAKLRLFSATKKQVS
jgi:hypothetical protein